MTNMNEKLIKRYRAAFQVLEENGISFDPIKNLLEINADKLISRMSEMNSPNIKERYENIYPERLPKPQKGTDSMTKRILYYYQHDTDDGVYSFWYDEDGFLYHHRYQRRKEG